MNTETVEDESYCVEHENGKPYTVNLASDNRSLMSKYEMTHHLL